MSAGLYCCLWVARRIEGETATDQPTRRLRTVKMNPQQAQWAECYQLALRNHLGQGPRSSLRAALNLGREAAELGLETLDVARIHEQVLKALVLPSGAPRTRNRIIDRTRKFFEETIVPIELTHRAAREDDRHVAQLSQTLRERTAQSTAANRRLARGVIQRQASEQALQQSGKHHAQLLLKSQGLQNRLRAQMRKILSADEDKRQQASYQLQNEIAQILVAIHVRLLTLKEAARANTENLKKEIAETQRLVKQSIQTIQRLANENGVHHEA